MKICKVCLDPGHGPGNSNKSPDGTYYEYEFAYDVATRVRDLLTGRGALVTMTRGIDGYPSLSERCKLSNSADADAFISFHTNAAGNGGWYDASGLELYTSQGPVSAPRNVLASKLLDQFKASGVKLRTSPAKYEGYAVLTGTNAPAVLIEYGFHTSKSDVALLKDSTYRQKLAEATAKGLCDFLGVSWDTPAAPSGETDREIVKRRFNFADATMDYLCSYQYADALLERLASAD